MSKLQELINKLCPNGVEFKPIWSLTTWDKKFKGVDRKMQPNVISYPYVLANVFDDIEETNGDVKLLTTGIGGAERWTTEEKAGANLFEGEIIAIPWGGTPNVKYYNGKFVTADNRIATSNDTTVLHNKFLYYWLNNNIDLIAKTYRGAGIQHPSMLDVLNIMIPVPPIEVQEEIVRILDSFSDYAAELQAELQARKQQYEYYRNLLLTFNPSAYGCGTDDEQKDGVTTCGGHNYKIQWKKMGEIGTFIRGKRFVRTDIMEQGVPCIHYGDMYTYYGLYTNNTPTFLKEEKAQKMRFAQKNDIVIVAAGENKDDLGNAVAWLGEKPAAVHDACFIFRSNLYPNYISHICRSHNYHKQIKMFANEAKICSVSGQDLQKVLIPVPEYELQIKIASILDRFETLVNDLTNGLPAEIAAVKDQYEYYRNKLLTFKKLSA